MCRGTGRSSQLEKDNIKKNVCNDSLDWENSFQKSIFDNLNDERIVKLPVDISDT